MLSTIIGCVIGAAVVKGAELTTKVIKSNFGKIELTREQVEFIQRNES
jgi:hypothetical protein